jgi:hypothetical protein
MKKIAIMFLCFGLYGCSSESDGLATLKELCEKDAGVTIYKTVEADGYYDAYTNCHHCWQELLKSEYQFVEFCDEIDRNPLAYAIPESGCYRVLKEKRAGNSCHVDIDKKLNKKSVEPYVSFVKDHCIVVEKIEKPEAPAKFAIKEDIFDKSKDTFFMRFEFIMEDYNDVLSRQVDYTYYTSHGRLPSYSCHHVIDGFKRYSIDEFAQKTINPNN